jgi:O-antigen/teichoic acid export membrane protein
LLLGYTVVGALAVFLLSLFSIETVEIFTQKAYYGAFRVMPLLYATTWVGGFVMFASGMQVTKNTFLISAVICSALLVNIVLAYYLIPSMNIKGAALGTLLSTLLYVIGLFLVSMKLYPYHFARKSLVTLVSSTILFVITISVIFESIVIRMNVAAKFSVSFILLTMVIFFFIFRDLDKKPQN